MEKSRNQIRILESQLLQGELTPDEFEALRDEALRSDQSQQLSPESQVISTMFDNDLEIAAGPEATSPSPLHQPDDRSSLMTPARDAFDEEEPTDPDSARSPDEIEDFTLSMILDTQVDLAFDPDLMLADVLAELEDDEAEETVLLKPVPSKKTKPKGPSIGALIGELPAALRILFASSAVVCLLLLSLGGVISTMGADEFGCLVAKRFDTVGVWRLYYKNLPVGRCSDRAKDVIRAAGLMKPTAQPTDNSTSGPAEPVSGHHSHPATHEVLGGVTGSSVLHPLEDPGSRLEPLSAPQIVDDPAVHEPGAPFPDTSQIPLVAEGLEAGQTLSKVELADIKWCAASKKSNSVDGWRDYLQHFPTGRCSARATHFLNTRAPTSHAKGGVLEQRSTNKGPSDFLVDTIVLNDASVRRCVRVARGRGRDVPTQMGIHFTIHSGGQTSGSRLVAPHLSGTSLDSCISEQVDLLRFPPWDGRDRTITYTLDLRRKATLPRRRPGPVQEEVPDAHEEEEHLEAEQEAEAPAGGGGGH